MVTHTTVLLALLLLLVKTQVEGGPTTPFPEPVLWQLPKGTTAVVTGGTKGIGRAIVQELAGTFGARVFTCARDAQDLRECLQLWRRNSNDSSSSTSSNNNNNNNAQGPMDVDGIVADVSTAKGRDELVRAIRVWLNGRALDILVNNVGTNIRKPSIEYTNDDIQLIWKTNFESMFALTVACHDLLQRRSPETNTNTTDRNWALATSSVVNVGSVAGVTCVKTGTIYASTKAAMNQLTGNWACEWGLQGIRVNCVAPWYINTPLAQQVLRDPAYRKSVIDRTPMGRVGEPAEVAAVVAFLCLPAAGYMTGQVVSVDGGFSRNGYYDSFYRDGA
jgi:tropinone reductase I